MRTLAAVPAVGTLVTYHGSLAAQHGTWRLAGPCDCERIECEDAQYADGMTRYVLVRESPGTLTCVRPTSFTPTTPTTAQEA